MRALLRVGGLSKNTGGAEGAAKRAWTALALSHVEPRYPQRAAAAAVWKKRGARREPRRGQPRRRWRPPARSQQASGVRAADPCRCRCPTGQQRPWHWLPQPPPPTPSAPLCRTGQEEMNAHDNASATASAGASVSSRSFSCGRQHPPTTDDRGVYGCAERRGCNDDAPTSSSNAAARAVGLKE